MDGRRPINYIYFGILFALLAFVHVYHLFLIEGSSLRWFYVFCAVGQCFLEVAALVLIYHFLKPYFQPIFIVCTFLLFLIHLIDFPLIRIVGMTIWYTFDWVFAESFENFIEMLYASNLSLGSWALAGAIVLLLPLLGILLFRMMERVSNKKALILRGSTLGLSLAAAMVMLMGVGWGLSSEESPYVNALPWKTTLFSKDKPMLKVGRLKASFSEAEQQEMLSLKTVRKPNIFLFIAESLRDDFLTEDVAPALSNFKAKNLAFTYSLSAANATQKSWFSIFHSLYPFYWCEETLGSPPLRLLKQAGYQVHVYSASRLRYYQMDERLFGKDHQLADTFQLFGDGTEVHFNDSACMSALMHDLEKCKEGHLFIVFLDSTHFGYSWPPQATWQPAPSEIDYFKIACSNQEGEAVKMRYRNAIHFVDDLFGRFWQKLKKEPTGKEAVIVFTGDHGEEFFEEGRIFHTSNLNAMQTGVPIYYRLGSKKPSNWPSLSSHVDIFPTILHHVFGKEICEARFDGESLLKPRRKNFAVSARHNGSRPPYEFLIHTGKKQLIARFENRSEIVKSEAVEVISYRDENGRILDLDAEQITREFQEPLEVLFR